MTALTEQRARPRDSALDEPALAPVAALPRAGRHRRRVARLTHAVVVTALALLFLFPLLWVLNTSLANDGDVYQVPPSFLPSWNWANYQRAWEAAPWLRYFGNTMLIAGSVASLCMFTSLLAGFSFALMRFRGRNAAFALVMGVLMIPHTVLLIPNFLVASTLGLLDTYLIQILPFAATAFGIFLIRQAFTKVSPEIFEAAEMDGAGPLRMLFSIGAPLVVPSLALVGLTSFLGSWNALIWPYIFTTSDAVRPIEVGLQLFYGTEGTDWTGLSAAVVFTTIPLIVLYLFAQRFFIGDKWGLQGAVRG
ncbi:carbohydrate ABC transporter permease [Cryobacterium melibiosiphilum]|uniref:Carbohydrate ABC transporter permease n=1 Tax=Cryobacterium melibiosiphilum TaxID=995039 RepID=A0A3A5MQ62_9MICO|nr:carbohydrate ABC transporter permease [Cryobacterium melibiosiphilum]RJT87644.1 carbohydrate ABC transporter permease [Cryobacterium melibiosiphilum]